MDGVKTLFDDEWLPCVVGVFRDLGGLACHARFDPVANILPHTWPNETMSEGVEGFLFPEVSDVVNRIEDFFLQFLRDRHSGRLESNVTPYSRYVLQLHLRTNFGWSCFVRLEVMEDVVPL